MREREQKRKKKQLAKLMQSDNLDLNSKVAEEHKKLMKAQKKMQAIRLIEELFKRIELRPELQCNGHLGDQYYLPGERTARARIIEKFKQQQQELLEEQRINYNNALNGRIVIRTALETKKPKRDSSMSSISSDERGRDGHKNIKAERLTTPEREMEYNKTTAGLYSMPYGFGYPFCPPSYAYPPQTSMYYPMRGQYYAPSTEYVRRPRGRGRGRGRGPRMPYFDGPDANHQYYRYFKKLAEQNPHSEYEDRSRGRSHSRSRSRRREHSRSRSRSRRRSYTRSRSRSRRSRSRSRRSRSRSRSRSRRSRSRSKRSRSHSRSRSHRRSRSRRSRSKSHHSRHSRRTPSPTKPGRASVDSINKLVSPSQDKTRRSRSWSQNKEHTAETSPKDKNE